jgi:hypothetical protein
MSAPKAVRVRDLLAFFGQFFASLAVRMSTAIIASPQSEPLTIPQDVLDKPTPEALL